MSEFRTRSLSIFGATDFAAWSLQNLVLSKNGLQLVAAESASADFSPIPPGFEFHQPVLGGQAISPLQLADEDFDSILLAWNAQTPPQTWLDFRLRVQFAEGDGWSPFYQMGVWSTDNLRYSIAAQNDAHGKVATDILFLKKRAKGFQIAVQFYTQADSATPLLREIFTTTVRDGAAPPSVATEEAWGIELAIPEHSQMLYPAGEGWCSPTSLVMVLGYWAAKTNRPELNLSVPATAVAVFDKVYDGCGNWPFNTAYAASLGGLRAYVTFLTSVADLEKLIMQGIPVIVSLAWKPGELDGAPISQSDGHLLVVRGFDAAGNLITNDPAANPRQAQLIRRVYDRQQFEHLWLSSSGGGAYVIFPET